MLKKFDESFEKMKSILGYDLKEVEQGSEEWFKARLGLVTASNAHILLSKKDSQTKKTYMLQLISEVVTGQGKEELSAKSLEWGKLHEAAARSAYEFETGKKVNQLAFIFGEFDSLPRYGASPDGLCDFGEEIKCPWNTNVHLDFILNDKVKKEYECQCQFSMLVAGCEQWGFSSYDPRLKITKQFHRKVFNRDEKLQSLLREALDEFIFEMDLKLAKLGVSFGLQWQ